MLVVFFMRVEGWRMPDKPRLPEIHHIIGKISYSIQFLVSLKVNVSIYYILYLTSHHRKATVMDADIAHPRPFRKKTGLRTAPRY